MALVDIQNEVDVSDELAVLLEQAVEATLRQQTVPLTVALSILLTDDEQIQQLNRDFLGYDKPTDVLSFPSGELDGDMDMADPELDAIYLGDIAISVPTAERQATKAGHAVSAEMQLLTIHGVLHLLGHDHADPDEKAAMWAAQSAVLTSLNLDNISPTEA